MTVDANGPFERQRALEFTFRSENRVHIVCDDAAALRVHIISL